MQEQNQCNCESPDAAICLAIALKTSVNERHLCACSCHTGDTMAKNFRGEEIPAEYGDDELLWRLSEFDPKENAKYWQAKREAETGRPAGFQDQPAADDETPLDGCDGKDDASGEPGNPYPADDDEIRY